MDNKRKLVLFLSAIAAVILIILIVSFWPNVRGDQKPSADVEQLFQDEKISPEDQKELTGQMGEKVFRMERKKLIETVKLNKQKVCPGEALKVTMNQNPDENAPIGFTTNRTKGNPAVIRFQSGGQRDIYVMAGDGRYGVDMKHLTVEVLDKDAPECVSKPLVILATGLSRTETETVDLEVKQVKGLTGKLRYQWEFGDGSREENDLRYVSHNYGLREQDKPESSFLAAVTVIDEKGIKASTEASVSIPNVHFIAKITGNPVIPAVYSRFPKKSGNSYVIDVTFKNLEKTPIEFEKAVVNVEFCREGKDQKHVEMAASRVLSGTSLGARQSVTRKLTIGSETTGEEACRAEIQLIGETIPRGENSVTATVWMEINVPPSKEKGGNAGASVEVKDPKLLEKLEKARAILGNDKPITPEDIRRLEKQGKI